MVPITREAADMLTKAHGMDCDPYEHCTWFLGTEDDFYCFDHAVLMGGQLFIVMMVLNSETQHSLSTIVCYLCERGEVLSAATTVIAMARDDTNISDLAQVQDNTYAWLKAIADDLRTDQGDEAPLLAIPGEPFHCCAACGITLLETRPEAMDRSPQQEDGA